LAIIIEQDLADRLRASECLPVRIGPRQPGGNIETVLRRLRPELAALSTGEAAARDGVSDPIPVPDGWLLVVRLYGAPAAARASIPRLLAQRLDEAGVSEAWLSAPPDIGERYEDLETYTPVVRALLGRPGPVPGPRGRPEWGLAEPAISWLRQQHEPGMELSAVLIGTELAVDWASAGPVVTGALAELPFSSLIMSDFESVAAGVVLGEFRGRGVVVWAAGSDWPTVQWTPADAAQRMRGLRDLIRAQAGSPEFGWGGVEARPDNPDLYVPDPALETAEPLPPMWYQVLSADRVRSLGGPPAGGIDLGGGRVELTIGEPEQWVPGHTDRDVILAHAHDLLPDTE
jgi:hypothetical protein